MDENENEDGLTPEDLTASEEWRDAQAALAAAGMKPLNPEDVLAGIERDLAGDDEPTTTLREYLADPDLRVMLEGAAQAKAVTSKDPGMAGKIISACVRHGLKPPVLPPDHPLFDVMRNYPEQTRRRFFGPEIIDMEQKNAAIAAEAELVPTLKAENADLRDHVERLQKLLAAANAKIAGMLFEQRRAEDQRKRREHPNKDGDR